MAVHLQTVLDPSDFTDDDPGDPMRGRLMVSHLAGAIPAFARLDALIVKRAVAAGWLPAEVLASHDPDLLSEPGGVG